MGLPIILLALTKIITENLMLLRFNAHRFSLNALRHFSIVIRLLLVALFLFAGSLVAQTPSDEPMLGPDEQIERPLATGQVHTYRLTLAADQYLHVIVLQHGIDVVVKLSGPDGAQLVETDSLNGTQGPEHLFWIAAQGGTYRLEVHPLNKPAIAGRYEVRTQELRVATENDKRRIKAETLFSEATQLRQTGTKESLTKAVQKFADAATQLDLLNDIQREVLMLNFSGLSYLIMGDKPKAFSSLTKALTLAQTVDDRSGQGVALAGLGRAYGLGEPQKAIESYSKALSLFRTLNDGANEADVLAGMGLAFLRLRNLPSARESFSQALLLARAVGERLSEARSVAGLGYVYLLSGEKQKAVESFNEALPIARSVGDRLSEADALAGLGVVHSNSGEPKKGLDYLLPSLPLFRAAGDQAGETVALTALGLAYLRLGDKQKSMDFFTQALPLARAVGDRRDEIVALTGLGFLNATLGETQKSLDLLKQALSIARADSNPQAEADALSGLGYAYGRGGEFEKAIESFTLSLPLFKSLGDRQGEALASVLLGFVYLNKVDIVSAYFVFNEALKLAREINNPLAEAQALNGLGALSLGEPRKSLDYLTQSLLLSRGASDTPLGADTLMVMGFNHFFSDEPEEALDSFDKALQLYRSVNDRQGELAALANLALVERTEDDLPKARAHIEAAIAISESLRTKIINQNVRTAFFSSVQEYYKFYIDLLMLMQREGPRNGYDGEALQASELSRARALLDTLNEAKADIREGVDPQLLERERSFQQRLNARAQEQMNLLSGSHTEEQARTLAKEIEDLTTAFEQVRTEIRQTSPRYAALTQPRPLTPNEIQATLDEDTLLLEYSLGSSLSYIWQDRERSYVWAVTSNSIKSYQLAGRREIEEAARSVYDLLNSRNKSIKGETQVQRDARIGQADRAIPAAASTLSRLVLGPVAAQLGKKRLVIVADGMLHYIPFAMLPDPTTTADSAQQQPLIIEHEIVNLPSASTLAVIRQEVAGRELAPKAVVALADPVFSKNDERIKRSRNTQASSSLSKVENPRDLELIEAAEGLNLPSGGLYIPRLRDSRKEAQEIVAMVPAAKRRLALDFEASRKLATSIDLRQYRYIHFSTHGWLNSLHPELSGIVFSLVNQRGEPQDGFLRAHETFNLKLPAELVVLSACQTGIGKEVKGEGLVSLTRGFMYAGAPRVVVSLWSVSEMGTTELMVRFYSGMLKNGLRPAAALRLAQLSLMKEKRWESPFYWAPFILQGEWR